MSQYYAPVPLGPLTASSNVCLLGRSGGSALTNSVLASAKSALVKSAMTCWQHMLIMWGKHMLRQLMGSKSNVTSSQESGEFFHECGIIWCISRVQWPICRILINVLWLNSYWTTNYLSGDTCTVQHPQNSVRYRLAIMGTTKTMKHE